MNQTTGDAASGSKNRKLSSKEILNSFKGAIEPVEVSGTYKVAILLVSFVMILLPLIYVMLIAAVVAGIFLHMILSPMMFTGGNVSGRGMIVLVLLYLAPIISGAILVAFMVKPLFSVFGTAPKTLSLKPQGEPLLFAFVQRICQAVGAPVPSRIDVNCDVNASASFRYGLASFLSNELVLTIGMPLVAGMEMRQFAGVLAHEFGHFGQGAGMRLSYIVRHINAWFARVVYERDSWDDWLQESASQWDIRFGFIFYLAIFFVWVTRGILWVFMMVGHLVSGFLLQQMEFDADRYEARLAGSDVFASTCRRLNILGIAHQGAYADLAEFYREKKLSDDLPKLILANVKQLPKSVLKKIDKAIAEDPTSLFDTHPADKDRIANAKKEEAPGIFHLPQPARLLFANYERICHRVSLDYYQDVLGPQVSAKDVHEVDKLLADQNRKQEAYKSLRRFLQRDFAFLRPFPLPEYKVTVPENAKEVALTVQKARKRMLQEGPAYDLAYTDYQKYDDQIVHSAQAASLLQSNLRLDQGDFKVPVDSKRNAKLAGDKAKRLQIEVANGRMANFEKLAGIRLLGSLQLLHASKLVEKLPDAQQRKNLCNRLLPILDLLNKMLPDLLALRDLHSSFLALIGNLSDHSGNEALLDETRTTMKDIRKKLMGLMAAYKGFQYPFEHGHGSISLATYLIEQMPPEDDPYSHHVVCEELFERALELFVRVAATLTETGERVEEIIGLKILPDPPEKEEEDDESSDH